MVWNGWHMIFPIPRVLRGLRPRHLDDDTETNPEPTLSQRPLPEYSQR